MASEKVIRLQKNTFNQEVLQNNIPVLVNFGAPWCSPCKTLESVLEKIACSFKEQLKICTLDVDQNGETAATYDVISIPTLLLFDKGIIIGTQMGNIGENELLAFLSNAGIEN